MTKVINLKDLYRTSRNQYGNAYLIKTKNGCYLQSFSTIVAYYSNKENKLYYLWIDKYDNAYLVSRSTTIHLNWFCDYLGLQKQNRKTIEKLPTKTMHNLNKYVI